MCDAATASLGRRPDLACVFFSPHHAGEGELIAATLADRLGTANVIGCLGESVVGTARRSNSSRP